MSTFTDRFPQVVTAAQIAQEFQGFDVIDGGLPSRVTIGLPDGSEVTGDLFSADSEGTLTEPHSSVLIYLTTGLAFAVGDNDGEEFEERTVQVLASTPVGVHDE